MAPQMEVKQAAAVPPQLPPGFRFRPTDQELVIHYLRPRALSFRPPAAVDIPDVRILAHDPAELLPPGFTEQERYFFTCKEAKYVKGCRANRATGGGYWKATGKEKQVTVTPPASARAGVQPQAVVVGMKRSLVFYRGKPPTGTKTEWVMHEYRLADAGLAPRRRGVEQPVHPAEGWVLCRVFRKKGSGPAVPGEVHAAADAEDGEKEEEAEMEEVEEGEGEDSAGFIDFFARADAAAARQPRAGSPMVSSSCLTDASHELHGREQETTSRGSGGGGA